MVNIGPDGWNIRMAQAAVDLPDAYWALVYSSSIGRISRVALDVIAPTRINADLSVGQEEEVAFFL